jgi:hypothetical protein
MHGMRIKINIGNPFEAKLRSWGTNAFSVRTGKFLKFRLVQVSATEALILALDMHCCGTDDIKRYQNIQLRKTQFINQVNINGTFSGPSSDLYTSIH